MSLPRGNHCNATRTLRYGITQPEDRDMEGEVRMQQEDEREVEELADQLQAQGPDEYPRGYYIFLARERLSKES